MTDELTDADLVSDEDLAAMSAGFRAWGHEVESMARELLALRARRAQDTPSDPAAADDIRAALANRWSEAWDRTFARLDDGWEFRAPGAVAAALTEGYGEGDPDSDEDEVLAVLSSHPGDNVDGAMGAVGRLANAARRDWFGIGTSPAPSAGEDEAAVERADPVLGYYARLRAMEPSDELLVQIEAGELVRQRELAAARGPRTQDDT